MIQTARLSIGSVPVDLEFEYTEGDPQTNDHPGSPSTISILAAVIGGGRIEDPESVFSAWQMETWENEILGDAAEFNGEEEPSMETELA